MILFLQVLFCFVSLNMSTEMMKKLKKMSDEAKLLSEEEFEQKSLENYISKKIKKDIAKTYKSLIEPVKHYPNYRTSCHIALVSNVLNTSTYTPSYGKRHVVNKKDLESYAKTAKHLVSDINLARTYDVPLVYDGGDDFIGVYFDWSGDYDFV